MKIERWKRRTAGSEAMPRLKVIGALLSSLALAGPTWSTPGGGGGMPGGGDSDSVGSLPSYNPGGPSAGSHDVRPDGTNTAEQFRLVLVGNELELESLVVDSKGEAPSITRLDERGTVRVAYSGDGEVVLDRARLARSFVTVQVEIGPAFTGGVAKVSAGRRSAVQALRPGAFDLHLQQLAWSRLTDAGIELVATTPMRQESRLTAVTDGEWIVLRQQP